MLGIYCRISRQKEEGKNVSIPDQQNKGIELASKLKLDYRIYIDEGISGTSKIEDRPEFSRLMADIEEGDITHVFAVDQSRIERNPQVRFVVNNILKKKGIKYFTEQEGEVDLHNSQSEFFGDILSLMNKFHVITSSQKSRSALRHRAKEGKANPHIQPYGYTKDNNNFLIVDEGEAKVVRNIFELSLSGMGQKSIAKYLDESGVKTRYAKIGTGTLKTKCKYTGEITEIKKSDVVWSGNTVRNIIKNPIYYGERRFKGNIFKAPSILDKDFWEKVNDNLPNNRNNSGKRVDHKYLLKGLLRCAKCNRNLYGRVTKKDNYYQCSSKRIKSCGNRSINIKKLEDFIWFQILINSGVQEELSNFIKNQTENVNQEEYQNNLNLLNKQLNDAEKKKSIALELVLDGIASKDTLKSKLNLIDSKIELIEAEITKNQALLNSSNEQIKFKENFMEKFQRIDKNITFNKKKEVVNEMIKNINVLYDDIKQEHIIEIDYSLIYPKLVFTVPLSNEELSKRDKSFELNVPIGFLEEKYAGHDFHLGIKNPNGRFITAIHSDVVKGVTTPLPTSLIV